MKFRTEVPIKPQQPKIDHKSKIFLLGSCFVENIGEKLEFFKFQTLQNPFGILFHPAAILNFLKNVKSGKVYSEEEIFFHNERWHCFEVHSALSSIQKGQILDKINSGVEESQKFLSEATHIIITLGTAWAYRSLESGKIVANCHKIPQKNFSKELLDVKEDLTSILEILKSINPKITVIFTVSPVRHLKDGFVGNQRSKSKLLDAVHKVISEEEKLNYFPSYEIMMDELRDYRFYAEDMIHPNKIAVDYIWEKFVQAWMSSETISVMEEIQHIQKGLFHRPFNEESEAHQKFLKELQNKMEKLQQAHPQIKF
ncbi:MAG TPA: GSCFA domain-containing protein [Salinimicrobium sp.]|nr:GSCFA domain-containing protein [Salinimicrobium sp.]